jgi:pyruvate dehydrogenase E1 component beta subunit
VEVVDLMTVQPWDKEAVFNSVGKTHRLVIAHEATKPFGIGAEVAASVAEEILDELDAPILRVGAPFVPIHYSLEKNYVPGAEDVKNAVRATLQRA